jgi:chorismate mutase
MSTHVSGAEHVEQVIERVQQELESLLQQRAAIIKRIGTIKRTILGLANLFGDEVISAKNY